MPPEQASASPRWRRIKLIALAACVLVLASGGYLALRDRGPSGPRAVIVNQLSMTAPNPEFSRAATETLKRAGYHVNYVPGEDVTVDYYRALPSKGYSLVILRSHSASRRTDNGINSLSNALFTSEEFDQTLYGSAGARLAVVRHEDDASQRYFGIRPGFIEQDARGRFKPAAVVVLMGCSGLRSVLMAQAFVHRGAASFVSWDQNVSVTETDAATLVLLERFAAGATVPDAVAGAMVRVGPDPQSGARLTYYPQ